MTAIASSITATTIDRITALFIVSLISSVMYHADRSEEKRYSQAEGRVERAVVKGSALSCCASNKGRHTCRYRGDGSEGFTLRSRFFGIQKQKGNPRWRRLYA